jgi:hypothetical protein
VSSDHLLRRGQPEGLTARKRRPAPERSRRDNRGRDPPLKMRKGVSATAIVVGPFGCWSDRAWLIAQHLDGYRWLNVIRGRRRRGAFGLGCDAYAAAGLTDTATVAA